MSQGVRDKCGVLGIWHPTKRVAKWTLEALSALQHRGEESAGIITFDATHVTREIGLGRIPEVFSRDRIEEHSGRTSVAHTRYSTAGDTSLTHAQPFVVEGPSGTLALAHNGNLTNPEGCRRYVEEQAVLSSQSDSELLLHLLAGPGAKTWRPEGERSEVAKRRLPLDCDKGSWPKRIAKLAEVAKGAYSLVIGTRGSLIGIRDPLGMRPLCLGSLPGGGFVLASESSALRPIGASLIRSLSPGEALRIDEDGPRTIGHHRAPRAAFCVFEAIYLSRPDTFYDKVSVHSMRQRCGEQLWKEAPADADVVVPVPESAIAAAIGYARSSEIPFNEGLVKGGYPGRTFLQPTDRLRREGVKRKYAPISESVGGKRVVLVDDSLVRGNTLPPIIRLLQECGTLEVHVRIASPPLKHPCFMGVDIATREELLATRVDLEEMRQHLGATSLAFLSVEGLRKALPGLAKRGLCEACFTGDYPALAFASTSARQAQLSSSFARKPSKRA